MGIMQGSSEGMALITQVYFQTQLIFSVVMLGFLKSTEMIGRVLSGLIWYKAQIPVHKRYTFTRFVYLFYSLMDMLLLFIPYPAMLINRFVCGGLGTASATVRESAVDRSSRIINTLRRIDINSLRRTPLYVYRKDHGKKMIDKH